MQAFNGVFTMAKIHESVTESWLCELIEESETGLGNPGICLACGEETEGCDPDAERYECDCCGKKTVFGAEQALLCGYFHLDK